MSQISFAWYRLYTIQCTLLCPAVKRLLLCSKHDGSVIANVRWGDSYDHSIYSFLFLGIGMPMAFAIGISGALFFLQYPNLPATILVQLPVTQTQNFALLAVPLFIFAGNHLNSGGKTQRLPKFAELLTGHMRGGFAQTSVVLSTLMGGVSGSAIADAAMEARLLGDDMKKAGYSKGFTLIILPSPDLLLDHSPRNRDYFRDNHNYPSEAILPGLNCVAS